MKSQHNDSRSKPLGGKRKDHHGVPKRAANPAEQSGSRQLRPRTAEDIAREQTAEQLALRVWAAMVAEQVLSGMSVLMDELIECHLLDDDDEEGDEGWLDDHGKREKKLLDEAIADGLDKYPDINAINNLSLDSDEARQLKNALKKCAIGATEFKEKFPHAQLERMVKRELKKRFEQDPKYSEHVRQDVPGTDIKSTATAAARRPRGRSPKHPTTRVAAGWPRCSREAGCVSPRIASTPWRGRTCSASSEKPTGRIGGITFSSPSGTATRAPSSFPGKNWLGPAHPPFGC
jgi:hypothetical protein